MNSPSDFGNRETELAAALGFEAHLRDQLVNAQFDEDRAAGAAHCAELELQRAFDALQVKHATIEETFEEFKTDALAEREAFQTECLKRMRETEERATEHTRWMQEKEAIATAWKALTMECTLAKAECAHLKGLRDRRAIEFERWNTEMTEHARVTQCTLAETRTQLTCLQQDHKRLGQEHDAGRVKQRQLNEAITRATAERDQLQRELANWETN